MFVSFEGCTIRQKDLHLVFVIITTDYPNYFANSLHLVFVIEFVRSLGSHLYLRWFVCSLYLPQPTT